MNYNIYLFDLDGTLLNLGNIGKYSNEILLSTLKQLDSQYIPNRNEKKNLWLSGEKYRDILKNWGIDDSEQFWKLYDKIDFERRKDLLKNRKILLFDDVISVLEKLNKNTKMNKLAIVTNTANYILHFILNYFNISHYFHDTFSLGFKDDQLHAKPSPHGIFAILKKFNYEPKKHKAIMIGDSIHDIKAAKNANILSCLIKRDFKKKKDFYQQWDPQPDFIIESLFELFEK